MREAVFLRVLDSAPEDKGRELARLAAALSETDDATKLDSTFLVKPSEFSAVPGSPFAYWVGAPIREVFRKFPQLEGNAGTVKQGLATADDFRFVRTRWEVDPTKIGFSPVHTGFRRGWVHFAKGGSFSPYYADIHLVVNWFRLGLEIKNFFKPNGRLASRPQNEGFYFRPGLTWPLRTSAFCAQPLPTGCITSVRGSALVAPAAELTPLLGFLSGAAFDFLFKLHLGRDNHPQFDVGTLRRMPFPDLDSLTRFSLEEYTLRAFRICLLRAVRNEVSCEFSFPSLLEAERSQSLARRITSTTNIHGHGDVLHRLRKRINSLVLKAYGLKPEDIAKRSALEDLNSGATGNSDADLGAATELSAEDHARAVGDLLMWCVGVAFGRWDVRTALDRSLIPELQGPFDRLPQVAPGGLVGPDALPATRNRIASEAWLRARPDVVSLPDPGSFEGSGHITAADYPVQVAWDGVLVDDPGHRCDIVGRIREVLRFVYGADCARTIEAEALDILRNGGTRPVSLRDWFRGQRAGGLGRSFFDFHIWRYSKSRRKAPIYWRLCTNSGRRQSRYGVWLYCHRLTDDTLWTVLNDYVGPRREREERKAEELKRRIEGTPRSEVRRLEGEREEAIAVLEELQSLDGELRKVAEGGWGPELDDGVVINLAPLHAVVPWQEPENVWTKLERGDYDWAHLALRYWPERVREKCQTDRSLAIAHSREELYHDE